MLHHSNLRRLSTDTVKIDRRLKTRLTRWELLALGLALSMAGIFAWVHARSNVLPYDFEAYISAGQGDLFQHYYMDWILPLYWVFARLPMPWGYILWNIISVLCVFFAARVFGGNSVLAVLSYQMFYVMYLGQITGILLGGLALGWWAMAHKRWYLTGLGLLLAFTKVHIGVFGLLLWLMAELSWRQRLRTMLIPAVAVVVLFLLNPAWPLDTVTRIQNFNPIDWASISLWRWIGPAALLFWIPPLALPLARKERFLALMATVPLALPYFQQADLLSLFVLPFGWLPVLLGNLGYLFVFFGYQVLSLLWIVPLVIYAAIILPPTYALLRRLRPPAINS